MVLILVLFCFLNKEYHSLSISQGHIYLMCILSLYLHIKNHKITLLACFPPSIQIFTYSIQQNFSSKLYFQPQHHPRIKPTIYFILLIGLSYPQVSTQEHLIYNITKTLHIHNYYITPQNKHPTYTIQQMSPAHNTTKSTIFHHTLTPHMDIPHLTTHFQIFPPHTPITYLHNITYVNHPHIEYPQWPLLVFWHLPTNLHFLANEITPTIWPLYRPYKLAYNPYHQTNTHPYTQMQTHITFLNQHVILPSILLKLMTISFIVTTWLSLIPDIHQAHLSTPQYIQFPNNPTPYMTPQSDPLTQYTPNKIPELSLKSSARTPRTLIFDVSLYKLLL